MLLREWVKFMRKNKSVSIIKLMFLDRNSKGDIYVFSLPIHFYVQWLIEVTLHQRY